MGTSAKVGVTFTAILLASYISGLFLKKTALLECSQHGDFLKIQERYGNCQAEGLFFQHRGIDYFPYASEGNIIDCFNQEYACIVIDFGCDYVQWKKEFLRCQRKILLGSTSDWEMGEFRDFLRWTQIEQEKSWLYAAFLGSRQNRKRLEREMKLSIAEIPHFENPYWIDETVMRFFQEFLS